MATVIICEKNNAAQRVASILSGGRYDRENLGRVPVFRFRWKGSDCAVVGLRGHIMDLDYPREFNRWEMDDLKDMVRASPVKQPSAQAIASALRRLAGEADRVIVATDFDREGELIGAEALDIMGIGDSVEVKRARFSSLTGPDVRNAFDNLTDLDRNLARAAEARQVIDLAWGAVLTRFMSTATGRRGQDFLSVGRVQTPALALVVDKEKEIESFTPRPFWEILADLEKGKHFLARHSHGLFWEKEEADRAMKAARGADRARVRAYNKEIANERPPPPFDTTVFLAEASRMGISPARAMAIAERLYNDGLISYPRTDNTVYPRTLSLRSILETLRKSDLGREAEELLAQEKLRPTRGKRETTDHPPIHPVGAATMSSLKGDNWRIYELVVRRFMATVAPDSVVERKSAELDINGEIFLASGRKLLEPGWRRYYHYIRYAGMLLPDLEEGELINVLGIRGRKGETKPPSRYTQGTLIREMERLGLGTKSTRHEIIQKLYDRGYIQGRTIRPTPSGRAVIEALEANARSITGPDMTRKLEEDMDSIASGSLEQSSVIEESREMLDSSLDILMEHRDGIRESVTSALRDQGKMGQCPKCGIGKLVVRRSKRGKRFMACDRYPECDNTYPLPQYGGLQPHPEKCGTCGSPQVFLSNGRRKPEAVCLNLDCASNKKRRASPKAKKGARKK